MKILVATHVPGYWCCVKEGEPVHTDYWKEGSQYEVQDEGFTGFYPLKSTQCAMVVESDVFRSKEDLVLQFNTEVSMISEDECRCCVNHTIDIANAFPVGTVLTFQCGEAKQVHTHTMMTVDDDCKSIRCPREEQLCVRPPPER